MKNIHKINNTPRNRIRWAAVELLVASPNAATREAIEKVATSSVTQARKRLPPRSSNFLLSMNSPPEQRRVHHR